MSDYAQCHTCGCDMPSRRQLIFGDCILCHSLIPPKTYALNTSGFKNNGASIIPFHAHLEAQHDNPVRG